MKKIFLFEMLIYFLFTDILVGQGELIISQYYEGASNDKWLEVTNVGNATLDLTSPQLYLVLFSNVNADDPANSSHNGSYTLTGSLAAGQILLFQNSSAVNPTYATGVNTGVCQFNGDDLVIISTSNSTAIGVAWANRTDVIGDGTTWGEDISFSRKTSLINPSTTFSISDWDQFTIAQVNGAGTGVNERLGEYSGYTPLPVELSFFSAIVLNNGIKLNWRTETEVNNYGFEILRSTQNDQWQNIGFVRGNGNSNSPKEYSFTDDLTLTPNLTRTLSYRLKQIDTDGQFEYSKIIEVDIDAPAKFELSQNYPNPFNPVTTIRYSILQSGNVKLVVYNLLGEQVAKLVDEFVKAGVHKINFNASELNSGIYFYKLETNGFAQSKKMILLK